MASIFSFETDDAKLQSPWPAAQESKKIPPPDSYIIDTIAGCPIVERLFADQMISTNLPPEPQDGPIEYKLHLLLRPRHCAAGTIRASPDSSVSTSGASEPCIENSAAYACHPTPSSSLHSRHARLQHLTTQLLWRLQQSSKYHASSSAKNVIPILPSPALDDLSTQLPERPVAGIEDSRGALYEIGVGDDGSLIGLSLSEMEESLKVLRSMAFSLGCGLQVLKLIYVPQFEAEAEDYYKSGTLPHRRPHISLVTEVLVSPRLRHDRPVDMKPAENINEEQSASSERSDSPSTMRVSLTGATTSGKSSLLGTLTTSMRDNGRGASRLNLLKHRHEIISGVTSSLAQELIGYSCAVAGQQQNAKIINYASPEGSSWAEIHHAVDRGRLVFVTDSAGHPKFRRTTLRGLVSWAPHWTLCCVNATEGNDVCTNTNNTTDQVATSESPSSLGYLELCLKLDLPLVIVVTKMDLANRQGLRSTLTRVMTILKMGQRKPLLMPYTLTNPSPSNDHIDHDIDPASQAAVSEVLSSISGQKTDGVHGSSVVPIVLASAVTGAGIGQLHALLRSLPQCKSPMGKDLYDSSGIVDSTYPLFPIDEVFDFPETNGFEDKNTARFILSGYVRNRAIQNDDVLLLGPFAQDNAEAHNCQSGQPSTIHSHRPCSQDLPTQMANSTLEESRPCPTALRQSQSQLHETWVCVRIRSIRHLRLPSRKLFRDQVGTIVIEFSRNSSANDGPIPYRVRRGMVLRGICNSALGCKTPSSYTHISAVFSEPNLYVNPGSSVTIYTASIRALARIVEIKIPEDQVTRYSGNSSPARKLGSGSALEARNSCSKTSGRSDQLLSDKAEDQGSRDASSTTPEVESVEILFRLINAPEWVAIGTQLVVTPASGISMINAPNPSIPSQQSIGNHTSQELSLAPGLNVFVGTIARAE